MYMKFSNDNSIVHTIAKKKQEGRIVLIWSLIHHTGLLLNNQKQMHSPPSYWTCYPEVTLSHGWWRSFLIVISHGNRLDTSGKGQFGSTSTIRINNITWRPMILLSARVTFPVENIQKIRIRHHYSHLTLIIHQCPSHPISPDPRTFHMVVKSAQNEATGNETTPLTVKSQTHNKHGRYLCPMAQMPSQTTILHQYLSVCTLHNFILNTRNHRCPLPLMT